MLNVVQIFISMAIYYPFFKTADRLAYKNEQEEAEAQAQEKAKEVGFSGQPELQD
ncbi:hypothetical protein BpJC4_18870 [Weizmannia acidilactici]|nr:hypothetical protein BpJC4_18870 [Weizmannia acidilactici]GER72585.1 hypothetical protein BpPP18_06520 [Weizmannia acidilactici]